MKFSRSLILLSKNSPRIAKAVNGFIKGSAYGELVMFPIAIGVAFMVDFEKIPPNMFVAQKLGITDMYVEIMRENGIDPREGYNGNGTHSGPQSGLV